MPRLLLNFGSPEQYEILLHPGAQSLGRDITNDVSIDDASISTTHCQIEVEPDAVVVTDLGSANGTFIDAQPVRQGTLRSGQTLRVGGVELLFDADTPADLIAAAAPALPAGPPEPPIPPPLPLPEPARGALVCKNHRKAIPRYECKGCGGLFCDLCVTTRRVEGGQRKFCRDCGGECEWLSAGVLFEPAEEKSFFELLPGAFSYPFQGDGWILMGTGTLFFMFMEFLLTGPKLAFGFFAIGALITVGIFAYGYLFAYQMKIIAESAQGKDRMPDWPDFTGMGDVSGPFFLVLAVLGVCFLPGWIAMFVFRDEEWGRGLSLTVLALGGFYLPMAFLAISMFEAFEVLNPLFIIPSILRVWKEYAVACGVLAVTVTLYIAVNAVLGEYLDIPVVRGLVAGFVSLYFITVEMRVLGLLYRTQQESMGWFRR